MLIEQDAAAFCRSTTCKGAACERDSDGCPAQGLPLFWPGGCVGFSFQRDLTSKLAPEDVRAAVRRSFQAWTQLPCKGGGVGTLTFSENDDTVCAVSEYDDKGPNVNVVLFRDDDFPYKDEDNTLAKTTVTYDASNGAILDADIEVNAAFNELTTSNKRIVYDLESIMVHEVGHFIGVAHSPEPDATMYASYETGQTSLRTLDADDIAAACAIYDPTREVTCDATPKGGQKVCATPEGAPPEEEGCSVREARSARAGAGLWGMVLLLLASARVRRGRRIS